MCITISSLADINVFRSSLWVKLGPSHEKYQRGPGEIGPINTKAGPGSGHQRFTRST